MSKQEPIKETDLYPPLRDYLVANGYTVRSEVEGCDIAAKKGDELVLIEIKRSFSTALLAQAVLRQRISPSVYVAIPKPGAPQATKKLRDIKRILRRLELGLILVNLKAKPKRVDVAFHPTPFTQRMNKREQAAVLREINGRTLDLNRGGANRTKIVTAYRENAIQIACCLERFGPMSPAKLRAMDTGPKTLSILYDDVYGWFDRVGHGIYELRPKGKTALKQFADLAAYYREQLDAFGDAGDGVDAAKRAG